MTHNINLEGVIAKMHATLGDVVSYALPIGNDLLPMNRLLGTSITLTFLGQIECSGCGRQTKKSFSQGYCFPCFKTLARCDTCIIKPELCHYAAGTCREPEWGEAFCMQSHCIYLANSSGLKVGITRQTQIPTRWIDQGAVQALPIFQVATRLQSGLIEVALKNHVADKTNWRTMLKGNIPILDLELMRDELLRLAAPDLADAMAGFNQADCVCLKESPLSLNFPVDVYPEKVRSHSFDKTPVVQGVLQGIKGQYLLLDTGVINMRKFAGYRIRFEG